jgi:hypothetical protein
MFGRARRRVLLIGEGRLADACARALDGGAERVIRRRDGIDARDAGNAERVILAGLAEPGPVVEALTQRRRRRSRPLPLVLVDAGARHERAGLGAGSAASAGLIRVQPLRVAERAARELLRCWPLHWGADPCFGQPIHLLVVGDDAFAEALVVQALRIGQYGEQRSTVTWVADAADDLRRRFTQAYPQAGEIASIHFQPSAAPVPPALPPAVPPVSMVVVGTEEPERALTQAIALRDRLTAEWSRSPPLLVEIGDAEPRGALAAWDGQLVPFSRLALALDRASLLDERGDELARVIHEHYRDTTEAQGRDPSTEAAGRPWQELAASYRDANRHQADHVWAKLAVTDCRAVPEERVESFAFAPIEVERLAMIEHARWAADRWLDGWSYAPERDNGRKHHPQLVPYQALSGPMKDLDRFAVRLVPTLLARSGLGVLRMLLVGVVSPPRSAREPSERSMRQILERLVARYPDRALIVASSLADAATRRFVRIAQDDFGAGFFLLLAEPIDGLLEGVGDGARERALALIARAERRVQLPDATAVQRWLGERAEILVDLGGEPIGDGAAAAAEKRVRVDPSGGLAWNFEY